MFFEYFELSSIYRPKKLASILLQQASHTPSSYNNTSASTY
jgi:hypothetical protein